MSQGVIKRQTRLHLGDMKLWCGARALIPRHLFTKTESSDDRSQSSEWNVRSDWNWTLCPLRRRMSRDHTRKTSSLSFFLSFFFFFAAISDRITFWTCFCELRPHPSYFRYPRPLPGGVLGLRVAATRGGRLPFPSALFFCPPCHCDAFEGIMKTNNKKTATTSLELSNEKLWG